MSMGALEMLSTFVYVNHKLEVSSTGDLIRVVKEIKPRFSEETTRVAGVAALLMAAHPSATVSEIATVLKETARHPAGDHNRPDNRWGYGIIQPQEALSALSS